ncbi:MAG: hypothetical protein MAGBODY4_00288 [Candidatus Marinimicrobia bacterium]|nr:hypothetical protein [Candidatus Neomarinimicrobiota bacterium]
MSKRPEKGETPEGFHLRTNRCILDPTDGECPKAVMVNGRLFCGVVSIPVMHLDDLCGVLWSEEPLEQHLEKYQASDIKIPV